MKLMSTPIERGAGHPLNPSWRQAAAQAAKMPQATGEKTGSGGAGKRLAALAGQGPLFEQPTPHRSCRMHCSKEVFLREAGEAEGHHLFEE